MLRSIIEAETLEHFFWVSGKIDRFYKSDWGHIYFDLVDGNSSIRCMLHERQSGDIAFDLKNHLDIEVYGDVHFYETRAVAQINVLNVRLVDSATKNTGTVEALRAEGLFPPQRKPAPNDIRRIGLITSRGSRAIGDFETTYQAAGERAVLAPLTWQFVHLEGNRARQSIVDGITLLDSNSEIDVIAIIRGGGRYEDLAVFDEIDVVRAISGSRKYILTGIGHHRDHTLADDVADYVAATPTAAATYLASLCLGHRPKADSNPKYAAGYRQNYEPAKQTVQPSVELSWRYKALLVTLLLLAIGAVMFLGYAILQTI